MGRAIDPPTGGRVRLKPRDQAHAPALTRKIIFRAAQATWAARLKEISPGTRATEPPIIARSGA
jgi:hypothetical protein